MNESGLIVRFCPAEAVALWRAYLDALRDRGIEIFATIDHKQNAEDAGLAMPETRIIVFGNPQAGTPLMLQAPDLALDLPLRVLVRESKGGCELVYTPASTLASRYGLATDNPIILKMDGLLVGLADQACAMAVDE